MRIFFLKLSVDCRIEFYVGIFLFSGIVWTKKIPGNNIPGNSLIRNYYCSRESRISFLPRSWHVRPGTRARDCVLLWFRGLRLILPPSTIDCAPDNCGHSILTPNRSQCYLVRTTCMLLGGHRTAGTSCSARHGLLCRTRFLSLTSKAASREKCSLTSHEKAGWCRRPGIRTESA